MPAAPRLEAEGLSQRFGRRVLFRDLGLGLGPGDSLAVTGRNGAGKSTLLQIIAGVLTPTAGSVRLWLDDAEVGPEDRVRQVGFVAPYLQLYDAFSAEENLAFLAQARRLPEASSRIGAVLDRVGLSTRSADLVGTYSSGMKQRARFAAALLADPAVLLLDEPTSNLDEAGRAFVESLAGAHCAAGGLLVVATNVASETALCQRELRVGDS
ncbi:MAG: ABC transporter ATP-binding protein [Bacteroidota bacterium]